MKLKEGVIKAIKSKEVIYPVLFIIVNLIFLVVEYTRFGEFYIPLDVKEGFANIFYSNRPALISAISIYLSSFVALGVLMIKVLIMFSFLSIKSYIRDVPKIKERNKLNQIEYTKMAARAAIRGFMPILLILLVSLIFFRFFFQITEDIGAINKVVMLISLSLPILFIMQLKENLAIFMKSIFMIFGIIILSGIIVSIQFMINGAVFPNYIAAFGILALESLFYFYACYITEKQKKKLTDKSKPKFPFSFLFLVLNWLPLFGFCSYALISA